MTRRRWIGTGAGAALAAAVGLGLLVAPGGASAAPNLPPVSPEDLVASVAAANPAPFAGTVTIDNNLGLPALPQLPQAANGTSTVRVWNGGGGKDRVAVPSGSTEKTMVADGTTRWSYDSAARTATRAPETGGPAGPGGSAPADPAAAAQQAIATLRSTSTVTVDGTQEVAGRPAYTLVLTPAPTERTLLRQVRVAVDAEMRIPLQLTVLAQGSPDPALQVGFTDLAVGPQDPSLFAFTPPPGTTVKDAPARPEGTARPADGADPAIVGDGWDAVAVISKPAGATPAAPGAPAAPERRGGAPDLSTLGTPVSGPWGTGRAISTSVATAIVTSDGRIAVGAVPEQVVADALTK